MRLITALQLLCAAKLASAVGCAIHSFTACEDNIVHWYDPDTGEVCDPLDCGGGRAPPKTDRPGCPLYKGTEIYDPNSTSILSCWKPSKTVHSEPAASTTNADAPETTEDAEETSAGAEAPDATPAATLSTATRAGAETGTEAGTGTETGSGGDEDATETSSGAGGAASTDEPNAGFRAGGSLVAVVGAAIGAMVVV
ncbi:uncharacterized protein DNG_00082 [Cephalotrichum gorgonifer]|uniref:Siderophore biosynthesis n=1 Tax=Cephalotrichum gorgonifer TaxID=2041049 RepID=A0AAE8MPZ7_9PEZI|nr:uncharacterized protein DNG_00082 [Cephalotrichum gorgonifer]